MGKPYSELDGDPSNNAINRHNESLLCLYKFIANKDEKVLIKFDNFDIKSLAPE